MIDAQVHDDPVEPGEKLRLALEGLKALVDLEERFLTDVTRVVGVMHHPESDGIGPPLVLLDQPPEGADIATARIIEELSLVRVHAGCRLPLSSGSTLVSARLFRATSGKFQTKKRGGGTSYVVGGSTTEAATAQ